MKVNYLKRLLSTALVGLMIVSMLSGCGNSAQESGTSEIKETQSQESVVQQTESSVTESSEAAPADDFEHDPVLNDLGVEPMCKETVKITIGLKQNSNITDYDDNYYTKLLEEKANVDLEFVLFPSNGADDKLRMMVMSGEELPDIITWSPGQSQIEEWGRDGYLIPLDEYYEHSVYYAAQAYEEFQEASGIDRLESAKYSDGVLWGFAYIDQAFSTSANNRLWVYEPWLKTLNLEPPTTTDEFYEMLVAFKTQDPNGNGIADEIPLVGSEVVANKAGARAWEYLMNAFQPSSLDSNFLNSNDGQLSFPFDKEEWKDGVKYIRKLVEEGLYDPVSFTQDAATFKQLLNSTSDQLVGCFNYSSTSQISTSHPSRDQFIMLDPLMGPEGVVSVCGKAESVGRGNHFITADCEHPEVAFRLLDLMCEDYISIVARYGIEGKNWAYVEDAKKMDQFKDVDFSKTFAGYPALIVDLETAWGVPGNAHWMGAGGNYMKLERLAGGQFAGAMASNTPGMGYVAQMAEHVPVYKEAEPEELVYNVTFATPEDTTEAELIMTELKAYVLEKLGLWCTGAADVDAEWDTYLKELEEIGAYRYLELAQPLWSARHEAK